MQKDNEINLDNIDYSLLVPKENITPPPKRYKINTTKKYLKYYGSPITVLLLSIAIASVLWALNVNTFWIYLSVGLLFPFGIGMLIFLSIRLYLDRNRLKNVLIKTLTKNFIIANFMLSNKRILKRVYRIDNDGISFKTDNQRYVIDINRIWYDENNHPNLYYVPNIPVPLEYNFFKYLKEFRYRVLQGEQPNKIKDEYNRPIDVMYTSESLETFRRDKFLNNFHSKTTPEMMKAFYFICVAFTIVVLAIIGYMYLTRRGVTV